MKKLLFIISLVFMLSSCENKGNIKELYFIGDSMIASWDIDESLNLVVSHNLGVSGSRVDYLESLAGTQTGHDVVIISGTNDMYFLYQYSSPEEYAQRYISAVENLGARHIFLFSILPREYQNERNLNEDILKVNACIMTKAEACANITYMNVFNLFMKNGHIDYDLYSDGLHLSPQGYEILSSTLRKHL